MGAGIKPVQFYYTNHRGVRELRTVTPVAIEKHIIGIEKYNYPPGSWMLNGFCHDRGASRSFLLSNIEAASSNDFIGVVYRIMLEAQETNHGQS